MSASYLYVLGGLVLFAYAFYKSRTHRQLPLPPGPHGHSISGIKHLSGTPEPWKLYNGWAQEFQSPMIFFRVYNRKIIVLDDPEVVHELLEKRAIIYSDRPRSSMYHDICGRKKTVFNISSLGPRHKQYRRLLKTGLSPRAVEDYWPLIQSEVDVLLRGLMSAPQTYEKHIRRNAAAVVMKMAYGYTVVEDDPFIQVAEEASRISGFAMAPGRWLVDYFPIIRHIPSFLPGAGWKRQGEAWRKHLDVLSGVPHAWVKEQLKNEQFVESFTSRHLRPNGVDIVDAKQEDIIKWCAGALYAGAGDTTVSALLSFLMLMAVHPAIQNKAQTEINCVIGENRVPHPSEIPKLHYLLALMKEVLRFAPVANLALPHCVTQEDEYNGYRIPKNATIIPNVWAILHNHDLYPNPYTFDPERFLTFDVKKTSPFTQTQPDPRIYAFGFGRRRCPGVQFAETTTLLTMAGILAKFNISLPYGTLPPVIEFTPGITSHIKTFDIKITSRLHDA